MRDVLTASFAELEESPPVHPVRREDWYDAMENATRATAPLVRTGQGEYARDVTPVSSPALRATQIYSLILTVATLLLVGFFSPLMAMGIGIGLVIGWVWLTP